MILGIDAFNIRTGGCLTHLREILSVVDPHKYGVSKVIIWGSTETLSKINDKQWLEKVGVPLLNHSLLNRLFWHRFLSRKIINEASCSILFVPGGSNANGYTPVVTMSRNMLPFEWCELSRYRSLTAILRLLLIRRTQINSFKNADGVIFLAKYARDAVYKITGDIRGRSVIIPHGVNRRFFSSPRPQRLPSEFNDIHPCRVLYVSAVYAYKHQWHVAEAVSKLRIEGVPVTLDLIGAQAEGMKKLIAKLDEVDPERRFIKFHGAAPYEKLNEFYQGADIGVFASSCENMPNILLENMAAGLPIACSNMGPMPELLGDSGVYFNPCDANDIASALRKLIYSADLRNNIAQSAFARAQQYSWKRCADETFAFLSKIAKEKL
jgi:glycosyltransferase involved in cell wall biosynthesis